jgi:hypothetical protein
MRAINMTNSKFAILTYSEMMTINGGEANTQEAFNVGYEIGNYVSDIVEGSILLRIVFKVLFRI